MEETFRLVSVCVITYNSSKTILETLDSICAQTYPHLELIVSDDCSTDNTVELCRDWMNANKERFVSDQLIVREQNGGVGNNLNTGMAAAKGEWIKFIAGDDLLLPNCITDNMDYVDRNPWANAVLSKAQHFIEENGNQVRTGIFPDDYAKQFFDKPSSEQYKIILRFFFVPSVTLFIKRGFALSNPFPYEYPYCEDFPYYTRLTRGGEKLYYFDTLTVLHRQSETLSSTANNPRVFVNPKYHESQMAFFYSERLHPLMEINPEYALTLRKEFFLAEFAVVLLHNRRDLFSRIILLFFKKLLGVNNIYYFTR